MKNKKLILLFFIVLIITGCKNSDIECYNKESSTKITVNAKLKNDVVSDVKMTLEFETIELAQQFNDYFVNSKDFENIKLNGKKISFQNNSIIDQENQYSKKEFIKKFTESGFKCK